MIMVLAILFVTVFGVYEYLQLPELSDITRPVAVLVF